MTIEKLEALERAKDDPTCTADEFVEHCTRLAQAQQAAFPHLLAVAKAAKAFDEAGVRGFSASQRGDVEAECAASADLKKWHNELTAALSRLEAQ